MALSTVLDLNPKKLRLVVAAPVALAALLGMYKLGGDIREREVLERIVRQGMQEEIAGLRGDLASVISRLNTASSPAKEGKNVPSRPVPLRRPAAAPGGGCDDSGQPARHPAGAR